MTVNRTRRKRSVTRADAALPKKDPKAELSPAANARRHWTRPLRKWAAAHHGGKKYLGDDDGRDGFGVDRRQAEQRRHVEQKREHYHATAEAEQAGEKTAGTAQERDGKEARRRHGQLPKREFNSRSPVVIRK